MEANIQEKIQETVLEILKDADMDNTTEYMIRNLAAEKLEIDLSTPEYKRFVRKVVESFLTSRLEAKEERVDQEEEDVKEEEVKQKAYDTKEYNEDGDLVICRLSDKRRVTIQDFRGKSLVSIREYYEKDGKLLPSSKGISLSADQWAVLKNSVPAIEEAISQLERR